VTVGQMTNGTIADHWDSIFQKTDEEDLGWHESDYSQTLKLLKLIPGWEKQKIFLSGIGTSGLAVLLANSAVKLVLNDISTRALEILKRRLGEANENIHWICQDISKALPANLVDIDIWIDRAVLHFLKDEDDVVAYFDNVNNTVKVGGHILLAEFSKTGASRCANLDTRRYDANELQQYLPTFELVVSEEYTYVNPGGDSRPYIYCLFQRSRV